MPVSRANMLPGLLELRPEQGIGGAEQADASGREQRIVADAAIGIEILVELKVAIMRAVSEIIDHHDLSGRRAHALLPACIELVMIDNEPIQRNA